MKKLLIGLLLIVVSLVGVQSSNAIKAIVGTQVACDTAFSGCSPIPLSVTTLCILSCAVEVSPSFTSSTRFWGSLRGVGTCKTSIDGGVTWANCASQPFTLGNREFYAEASDGSIVAVGTPAAVCTIRRSTNNGTSWSDVFTQASQCTSGGLEGQRLICLSNGACEFIGNDNTNSQVFRTSNNGASWSAGEIGLSNTPNVGMQWNGSIGVSPTENPGAGGGFIVKAFTATGDVWTESTVWNGTQGDCWGEIILNGTPNIICQAAGATPDGRYTLRSSTGANLKSLDIPNALITSLDSGGIAISPFANTIYFMAQTISGATMGTWVSTDSGTTFIQLTGFGGGGAGVRGGNAFYANGCVYFSVGLTPMFGKIC